MSQHPKISDLTSWQQAEMLMQPAFIRVVDTIRKYLDQSSWEGHYRQTITWAEDVPETVREQVLALEAQLQTAAPEQHEHIHQTLAQLPNPLTSYWLCLCQNGQEIQLDLWELCYQICFQDYRSNASGDSTDCQEGPQSGQQNSMKNTVKIDVSLITDEGEVDWLRLDAKTRQVIDRVFSTLPIA